MLAALAGKPSWWLGLQLLGLLGSLSLADAELSSASLSAGARRKRRWPDAVASKGRKGWKDTPLTAGHTWAG
jgi:hypothetical protein